MQYRFAVTFGPSVFQSKCLPVIFPFLRLAVHVAGIGQLAADEAARYNRGLKIIKKNL